MSNAIRAGLFAFALSNVFKTVDTQAGEVFLHRPTIGLWNKIAADARTSASSDDSGGDMTLDQGEMLWRCLYELARTGPEPDAPRVFEFSDREAFLMLPVGHPIAKLANEAVKAFAGGDVSADLAGDVKNA